MCTTNCPDRRELVEYLLGILAEEDAEQLERHVSDCEPCEETVARLENLSDTVIESLRRPAPDSRGEARSGRFLREALDNAHAMAPVAGAARSATKEQPPDAPAAAPTIEELGNYRLIEQIGQGGMGTVYRAVHTKLERPVALKILSAGRAPLEEDVIARFEQEMRAIGKLDHPNLVRAFDAGESPDNRQLYLAMELVEGVDAAQLVDRLGPLPIADACEIARQTAVGLAYVHQQGLVHRDVKPSNLMVAVSGQSPAVSSQRSAISEEEPREGAQTTVKILDLGLALLNTAQGDELTVAGQMMGTLDYMAPEQASDSHLVDHRADIYALGCTLYKTLAGRAPFADQRYSTAVQKIMAHAQASVPSLTEQRPDVPEDLADVVERMLAKEPEERFETTAEVAQALTPFAQGSDLRASIAAATGEGMAPASSGASKGSTFEHVSSVAVDTHPSVDRSAVASVVPAVPPARRRRVGWSIAVAVAAIGLFVAAAFVIRLMTDNGELIIESSDPGIRVVVTQSGEKVRGLELEKGENVITLRTGDYQVELEANADDVQIENGNVTLNRNGKAIVQVRRKVISQFRPPPVEGGAPISPFALVSAPARIQGVQSWTIQTAEHRGVVDHVALSPDGRRLAMVGGDGAIRVRDTEDGNLIQIFETPGLPPGSHPLGWSPNGNTLACVCGGGVRVWDVRSGRLLRIVEADNAWKVVWSPDGAMLATGNYERSGTNIRLWDFDSGELVDMLPTEPDGLEPALPSWSPNGEMIAALQPLQDRKTISVHIWDANSGEELHAVPRLPGSPSTVLSLCWSPDSKRLVFYCGGGQSEVCVLDVASGEIRSTFDEPSPGGIHWLPGGKTLAFGNGLWDIDTGKRLRTIVVDNEACPNIAAWSQDGTRFVTRSYERSAGGYCEHNAVELWDTQTGERTRVIQEGHLSPCNAYWKWLADGTYAYGDDVFDALAGKRVGPFPNALPDNYNRVFSSDAKLWAESGGDGTLIVYDVGKSKEVFRGKAHSGNAQRIVWSPNEENRRVAEFSYVSWYIWDISKDEPVFAINPGGSMVIAWSRDGTRLAAYAGGQGVQIWDVETGKQTGRLARETSTAVRLIIWSDDGSKLTTIDQNWAVVEWDAKSGTKLGERQAPSLNGFSRAFLSPDGRTVAFYSSTQLRVWQTGSQRLPNVMLSLRRDRTALISPEGHYRGSPRVEQDLVYIVRTDDGQQTLTAAEFEEKHGWKNDPSKVVITGSR